MTDRMGNLERTLNLVHVLTGSIEGLTLDEMAAAIDVKRRTVERMRDVILLHFDLEEIIEGRTKRFRINGSPGRAYTRPSAKEVAALQAVVEAGQVDGTAQVKNLRALLSKTKSGFERRERQSLDNDLDLLTRLQRWRVVAGPSVIAAPEDLTTIQSAILQGVCIDFDYFPESAQAPSWRRVVPYGLIHGPVTYLLGKRPDRDDPPVYYRLDRMNQVRASDVRGHPPEDWDLNAWLADSFGIWREEVHDITLRVRPSAVERARAWRFHPHQLVEEAGDELIIRFRSGGLLELVNHLFGWAGDLAIEGPTALKEMMAERLRQAQDLLAAR